MLQQTRVETVIPYYQRWMRRFPSLAELASASFDDVLKCWEGLGYYRRARYLHQTAQLLMKDHQGRLPRDYRTLLTLPGVGSYTAAALSSLVFDEPYVAVDGNLKRIASRLFTVAGQVTSNEVTRRLEPYLPATQPGAFNEALMDLGATVCIPKRPVCSECPLTSRCQAFLTGQTEAFPQKTSGRKIPRRTRYGLIHIAAKDIWLERRSHNEMLAGLWGFVQVQNRPVTGIILQDVHHTYTHFKLRLIPVIVPSDDPVLNRSRAVRIPLTKLTELAFSVLDRKILALLEQSKYLTTDNREPSPVSARIAAPT